jgi:dipeptidyl aminopeptidase/acylaminoacyl peptidase
MPLPGASHVAPKTWRAELIAYATHFLDANPKDPNDLWLYNVSRDRVSRLTSNGASLLHFTPEFINTNRIMFIAIDGTNGARGLYELNIATGVQSRILAKVGGVLAFDWNPDRTRLAFLSTTNGKDSVSVWSPASGQVKTLWHAPVEGLGRGGTLDDELSVSWSRDGTKILIVDTQLWPNSSSTKATIYLVRLDGSPVIQSLLGTQARWSGDSHTFYYRELASPFRWFALNSSKGNLLPLAMTPGTHNLVVSPDGNHLIYNDDKSDPSVYLYDLGSKIERRLIVGYADPIWISATTVLATAAQPCASGCAEEGAPPWRSRGWTAAISTATHSVTRLRLSASGDATDFCKLSCFGLRTGA